MRRLVGGALAAVLGCQGTSGGVLPDARDVDAAVEPCAEPGGWAESEPQLIAPHRGGPLAIAVDDAYVYWTEPVQCDHESGCYPGPIVLRAPLSGGEREVVVESEAAQPRSLVATRDYLFVTMETELWRLQKDGSAPEVVGAAGELATDGDAILFREGGQLVRLTADTLERSTVGEAPSAGGDLQVAGDSAWWLVPDPIEIWRMPLATGVAELAGQIEQATGDSLAVADVGRTFLSTWPAGVPDGPPFLVRVGPDGAGPEPIAELWDGVHDVLVDDAYVYWVEPYAGRLSRLPLDGGCVESRPLDNQGSTAMAPAADGILLSSAGNVAVIPR